MHNAPSPPLFAPLIIHREREVYIGEGLISLKMEECNEIPTKFSSVSSSENRDSIGSLNGGEDDEFYDKIEAPKFVDFTVPDHYSPDDHYWFCLRVG